MEANRTVASDAGPVKPAVYLPYYKARFTRRRSAGIAD